MKHDHDADDLLVLARRGDLPDADARRLRDALAASGEARLLYEAGRAFDREAPVLAGDDERIEELVSAVEKRIRPGARDRRPRLWAVRLCVAAALIAGAAVGAGELRSSARSPALAGAPAVPTPPEVETEDLPPSRARAPAAPAPAPPPIEPAETASVAPPEATLPTVAPPPPRVAPSARAAAPEHAPSAVASAPDPQASAPPAPPSLTAPELFAAANRARIAGDGALAVRLSRELEDRYPESREAVTTHLSLGLLYLQQGAPADALQEFRRYRAQAGGSAATMPEALWGQSQALHQLGRSVEERAVLEELLDRYPGSAYEAAARRRLADVR